MIKKQIVATTELDIQNQAISREALAEMADGIMDAAAATRMGIGHDVTILPIGKVIDAKIITLSNGHFALEAQIDDFISDFEICKGPHGETLYSAESNADSRPFTNHDDECNGLQVSLNPLNYTLEDFYSIQRFLADDCGATTKITIQKAAIPNAEIIFQVATGLIAFLTLKKTIDRSSDKLADNISDDISSCYLGIKKAISFLYKKIKGPKPVTYILSEANQPIELVVRTDSASVVMSAYEELSSGEIASLVASYSNYLGGELDKIQFVYNASESNWELSYMTTKNGKVIGTEKSYKNAVRLYNETMKSPSAGYSIGAAAMMEKEQSNV